MFANKHWGLTDPSAFLKKYLTNNQKCGTIKTERNEVSKMYKFVNGVVALCVVLYVVAVIFGNM